MSEAIERLDGLLKFLGCSIQDIERANSALETNGLEASMIRIPRAYIMGIPLEFTDCEAVDVASEGVDGSIVAYVVKVVKGDGDE